MLGASCLLGREGSRVNREFLVPRQSITSWKRSRERSFVFKNKRDGSPFSGKLCTLQCPTPAASPRSDVTLPRHLPAGDEASATRCTPPPPPFCHGCALDHVPQSLPACLLHPQCCPCTTPASPLQHAPSSPSSPLGTILLTICSSKALHLRPALEFERPPTCLHAAHDALKSVSHQEGPKPACSAYPGSAASWCGSPAKTKPLRKSLLSCPERHQGWQPNPHASCPVLA